MVDCHQPPSFFLALARLLLLSLLRAGWMTDRSVHASVDGLGPAFLLPFSELKSRGFFFSCNKVVLGITHWPFPFFHGLSTKGHFVLF